MGASVLLTYKIIHSILISDSDAFIMVRYTLSIIFLLTHAHVSTHIFLHIYNTLRYWCLSLQIGLSHVLKRCSEGIFTLEFQYS